MPPETVTTLAELKAIEQQRIAGERAAIDAEVATRAAAAQREATDREARRLAEIHAERAERIRIAEATAEAERQARVAIAAREAAEIDRMHIALEQERRATELQLRRELIARQRPTWMVVACVVLTIAAAGTAWLGIQAARDATAAAHRESVAREQMQAAYGELSASHAKVAALVARSSELDAKITALAHTLEASRIAIANADAERQRIADADRKAATARAIEQDRRDREHKANTTKLEVGGCAATTLGCMDGHR
jgi:hypothetical protein